MTKNSKGNRMGMNLKNTVRKSSHVDLKKIVNQDDALRAAVAKIQIQQDDCTEDCGYEILGTALICGAYYSDEDDQIDCMITYTSCDCFDCLCELLEAEEGYSNVCQRMNQKVKLVRPNKNVGACEGGADCGDGWCCNDADYPVCCPNNDFFPVDFWCAADADSCPQSSKTLPEMAAKKKLVKSMKMIGQEQCDGTDCGGGWYCNDPDYPVCCPDYDIFSNWSAVDADCCPQSSKILPKMAAKKNLVKSMKMIGQEQCDGTYCGGGWCCNDPDYPVCCPETDFFPVDFWCAVDADSCWFLGTSINPLTQQILNKMQ